MSLSIIIPVRNEELQIKKTLKKLLEFARKYIKIEIILINDFSTDNTVQEVKKFKKKRIIKIFNNTKPGLGSAIRLGIKKSKKKYLCIFMSDMSDDLKDLEKYYKIIQKKNLDAVFGSRFSKISKVRNYPLIKLTLNRIFNYFVKILFLSDYNDFTNAFKIYKKKSLISIYPLVSDNFNIFLELPLKFISRKYKYDIIPINWTNRKKGVSKFKIKELSSMYLFTLMYCFIEKILLKK